VNGKDVIRLRFLLSEDSELRISANIRTPYVDPYNFGGALFWNKAPYSGIRQLGT
jgi:hypothetical protein